jgi:hypothetical protein
VISALARSRAVRGRDGGRLGWEAWSDAWLTC